MSWTCTLIEQEFAPSETASITGVSTSLQRDWRRRKLVYSPNENGWTKWELDDQIRLSVMKLFSDSGMDPSKTGTIAAMAVMPTLNAFKSIPGAVEWLRGPGVSEEAALEVRDLMSRRNETYEVAPFGRFLAVLGAEEHDVCRTHSLAGLQELLEEDPRPVLTIVDCVALAQQIYARAGRAVIQYSITLSNDPSGEADPTEGGN
jgi:hypothetical protein